MKTLPITVIILAHRNNQNLVTAVTSASFAAEILVIDNASGVDWQQFSHLSVSVKAENEPITDFSRIRNQAIKYAQHDWVFFLDSDEEVKEPVIPQVAALLASSAHGAVAFRSDVFYGKKLQYGEAGHQQVIRIGKKGHIQFTGAVHETASITGELLYTKIQILHHAHPNISEFIDDVSQYAAVVAEHKTTSQMVNLCQLLVFPPAKLFYGLIIQGGILDGWRGLVYAYCMSLHSLLVRIYRYEVLANRNQHP